MFRAVQTRGFASAATGKVVIPPAIKRSSTSLLEALSATVGKDVTAPHFAFIDDPAMIPSTAATKRNYYMAKELGRRAARQLAQEWPTLFAFDRDLPRLSAFRPQGEVDPASLDATEENLSMLIEGRQVEDAAVLYEKIRAENKEISDRTQHSLFNLVVYYNGKNVPFSEYEEWHGLRTFGEAEPSEWRKAGVADLLFETIPKNAETKSTMVCGLCKFGGHDALLRAKKIMQDMVESKETPKTEAFNSIIEASQTFEEAKKCLESMANVNVHPTVHTFNSLLSTALKTRKFSDRVSQIEKVLGEMSTLNISPSLFTFDIILRALDRDVDKQHEKEKIGEKEKKELDKRTVLAISRLSEFVSWLEEADATELSSVRDAQFFLTAMTICQQAAHLELAQRVVSLYEKKSNLVRMPAFTLESLFYNRYLLLFIDRTADLLSIEKLYKSHVPRLVGVSRQLILKLADRLKVSPHWSLISRVIEDGVTARLIADPRSGHAFREMLRIVNYQSLSPSERESYSALVNRLVDVWIEFSRFTEENSRRMQVKMNPGTVAECSLLLTRIGEDSCALSLLALLLDQEACQGEEATVAVTGYPRQVVLMDLFEHALRGRDTDLAATTLEVLSGQLPRAKLSPLAERLIERCRLSPAQAPIVQGFVRLRPQ